ncbi:hypothetical protein BDF20DRAFT_917291 [Mycotypha africana]|uniref:uncharacterized protein n=1 Tax=Mycotypha africana TaxID=64632 RepID=UPI0022FFEF5D|nr:uncharacterized protein BDF20DRAFT_917291 [Mycotypha africana]KAI8967675.1 hypothetical protein BDF20DRAFT_917291 [Mycotypha africana]
MNSNSSLDREIVIKVCSTSFNKALEVKTTLNSDIGSLKRTIEDIVPNHPPPTHQRLIYCGMMLTDNDYLKDILKKVDNDIQPTFHLVVKPSLQRKSSTVRNYAQSQQHSLQEQQAHSAESSDMAASATCSTSSAAQSQQQEQQPLQQSQLPPQQSMNNTPQQQRIHNETPSMYQPSSLLPGGYQVIAINGQYYLAPVLTPAQPLSSIQVFQQPQPPSQQYSYVVPQNPQVQPQYQQRQFNYIRQYISNLFTNNNNNNQQQQQPILVRQGMLNGGMFQRATSIWLAVKLMVILFMVCQGASIERIFIFHTIAFIFFLYQTGRLRFVVRRVRAEDLNMNRNGGVGGIAQQQQQQQYQSQTETRAVDDNNNNNGTDTVSSTSVNHNNPNYNNLHQRRATDGSAEDVTASSTFVENNRHQPQQQQRALTALDTWKRGIYSFFASLWPTYGVDPRIAQAFNDDDNNNNNNDNNINN